MQAVFDHGRFVMGPEIDELEDKLAAFTGVKHVVSCSSGTDALILPLLAHGIGSGYSVFIPAFTFIAAAEVVVVLGATSVFIDVLPDTYNIDSQSLTDAIAVLPKELRPAAIVTVDLYGHPADYRLLRSIADEHDLFLVQDAAQSFGATLDGQGVGMQAAVAGTSFFPAKPLGCYGDGGAIFTNDDALAQSMRIRCCHGEAEKYNHVEVGLNFRLDTLQVAILLEKFAIFPEEIVARQQVAERYNARLKDHVVIPELITGATSVWAQYTIQVDNRASVIAALSAADIPTAVHYPNPVTAQRPYQDHPRAPGGVPVSERLAQCVMSLPMHPYFEEDDQNRIIEAVTRSSQ